MTLDLDELERTAKSADAKHPQPWSVLVSSSETDSAWFEPFGNSGYDGEISRVVVEFACAANPSVVLALIERVRTAETRVRELERLWAEESSARIRKLDLSTKDR